MPFYSYEIVPDRHAVIIDLKPGNKYNEVSLYQIEDVWGFSTDVWTPLALRLRPLFVDFKTNDAKQFKKEFLMPSARDIEENGSAIHEFLYANHDSIEGDWRWGRNGSVNAVLLWPEAFQYFVSSIQERMRGGEAQSPADGKTCIQQRRRPLLGALREIAVREVGMGRGRWHAGEDDLLRGMGVIA